MELLPDGRDRDNDDRLALLELLDAVDGPPLLPLAPAPGPEPLTMLPLLLLVLLEEVQLPPPPPLLRPLAFREDDVGMDERATP